MNKCKRGGVASGVEKFICSLGLACAPVTTGALQTNLCNRCGCRNERADISLRARSQGGWVGGWVGGEWGVGWGGGGWRWVEVGGGGGRRPECVRGAGIAEQAPPLTPAYLQPTWHRSSGPCSSSNSSWTPCCSQGWDLSPGLGCRPRMLPAGPPLQHRNPAVAERHQP
jgi:hypothetical protein